MNLKDHLPALKYGAKILASEVLGIHTTGNVYYVVDSTQSWYDQFVSDYSTTYADGSVSIFPHTSTSTLVTTNGIKNAAATCVSGRDDIVAVLPSTNTYYIDALLSLSKTSMHLVAPNMAAEYGSKNNVRLQQIGAGLAIMSIDSGGIEVSGFYLKNISTYAHITVPTTATVSAWGLNIHHNTFVSRSSTTSLPMLDCNGDGASYSEISRNWFQTQVTGGAFTNGIVDIEGSANLTNVTHNVISLGDNTATYGIRNKASNSLVGYNVILEQSGTFTSAITSIAGGSVVGNRCAVASGHFSDASATTVVGYCDNWDGVTFATTGGSDIMTKQLET